MIDQEGKPRRAWTPLYTVNNENQLRLNILYDDDVIAVFVVLLPSTGVVVFRNYLYFFLHTSLSYSA